METHSPEDYNERFRIRTKNLALNIILLYKHLKAREEFRIIGKQLIRAGTSVAANFRAACRARSNAEYYAKMCIMVEECDETLFWLELIQATNFINIEPLPEIVKETKYLLVVFARTKKSMKMNKGK